MTKTGENNKTHRVGRYQHKVRLGLVPYKYDYDSNKHQDGANKNWPSGRSHIVLPNGTYVLCHPSIVRADREFLERARASR